jgi:hypothetical protein
MEYMDRLPAEEKRRLVEEWKQIHGDGKIYNNDGEHFATWTNEKIWEEIKKSWSVRVDMDRGSGSRGEGQAGGRDLAIVRYNKDMIRWMIIMIGLMCLILACIFGWGGEDMIWSMWGFLVGGVFLLWIVILSL